MFSIKNDKQLEVARVLLCYYKAGLDHHRNCYDYDLVLDNYNEVLSAIDAFCKSRLLQTEIAMEERFPMC